MKKTKSICKSSTSTSLLMFHKDLMCQVLVRLPLKSLCISKSVCKSWLSIISHPEFMKLFRNQWKGSRFLLSIRDNDGHQRYLLGTSNTNNTLDFDEWLCVHKYVGVTQVINGLVCFYQGCLVWLCNLSTGEIMKLPCSHYDNNAQNFQYSFGFDPISRAYKLFKVDRNNGECKILTLGDMSWKNTTKKVESMPHYYGSFPCTVMDEVFCVDGSLYWRHGNRTTMVISFHLNQHHSELKMLFNNRGGVVMQFRGCPAFAYKSTDNSPHLHIMPLKEYTRTAHTFQLPVHNLIPFGYLPTGEVMLVDAEFCDNCIYKYDPESREFETFIVTKFPISKMDSSARISCFEPNFNPLSVILKPNSGL